MYDVLRPENLYRLTSTIRDAFKGQEVYLFANQIPLLGLGRSSVLGNHQKTFVRSPRLIAFSEVNDFLTYELVPYFQRRLTGVDIWWKEQGLSPPSGQRPPAVYECWDGTYVGANSNCPTHDFHSTDSMVKTEIKPQFEMPIPRKPVSHEVKALGTRIGFDVVDVRLSYAKLWIPFVLSSPRDAHTGYDKRLETIRMVLCGVDNSKEERSSKDRVCK